MLGLLSRFFLRAALYTTVGMVGKHVASTMPAKEGEVPSLGWGFDVIDVSEDLPSNGEYPERDTTKIDALVIHHTASEGVSWMPIAQFHTVTRAWAGIGYTWGVIGGQKFMLNKPEAKSNQNANNNTRTMGLCVMGNFQRRGMTPVEAATTTEFAYEVTDRFHIKHIRPHRYYKATACPGDSAMKALRDLWR